MSLSRHTASDYAQAFRRRAKLMVAVFTIIIASAVSIALVLPDVYLSSAEFRIDLQGPDIDQLRPIEVTNYADQYVDSLLFDVLSYENRREWFETSNVYADLRAEVPEEELIARIYENANIGFVMTPVLQGDREVDLITGFRTIFEAPDPESAYVIAELMAEAFLAADIQVRTERAASNAEFLDSEIQQWLLEINEAEAEIADFKEQYGELLPEMHALNMTSLERAERDLQLVETDIRSAEEDLIFGEAQLAEMEQSSGVMQRIREIEDQYLEALTEYSEDHPEVRRLQRLLDAVRLAANSDNPEIALLEAETAALRERYSDEHPDVRQAQRRLAQLNSQQRAVSGTQPNTTAYLQLQAQVNATRNRLDGLGERAADLRDRIDEFESRMAQMPQVEREYLALLRELDDARDNYDDVRRRGAQARQTEAFESGERGARIEQLTSARQPSEPAGPPRAAIMVIGLFLATTLGFGAGIAAEGLDPTVRGAMDILRLTEARPIAMIPVVSNSISRKKQRRKIVILATATVVVIALSYGLYLALVN